MELELRHLRCLVAIVDTGSFTDAAIELGVSQAAVSRTLLSLEAVLGIRLLHRTSRSVSPAPAGVQALPRARQLLAEADNLVREATTGHSRLRIGHAWSAMGRHTLEFQRRWADRYPDIELQLIRTNSATGGPWARRRPIRLDEGRDRTVALDRRTGTTTTDLWPAGSGPAVEHIQDIDDWLAGIAPGRRLGLPPTSPAP